MTYQMGVLFRNAQLNSYNTNLGSSATLKVFSGTEPANCAAADPSGLLCTITLPASPFGTASAGAITLSGTWSGTATATGTPASFRIYDSSSNCAMQGAISADMTLTPSTITSIGQAVQITTYTVTQGNA